MSVITKLNLGKYKNLVVLNQLNGYELLNHYDKDLSEQHVAIFIFVETFEEMVTNVQQTMQQQSLVDKGYCISLIRKKEINDSRDMFIAIRFFLLSMLGKMVH
ncbi:hypothetical protein [Gracilibacillus caseinilyticus]|uniref:hypothetical protein n=1 Tax=Gracilibacillus caseinilyticus TaxID=2932256 RepID=UPI00351041A7